MATQRADPALLTLPLKILPDPLHVPPLSRPFAIAITPPGSKSLTNRAILLAALSRGRSILRNPLLDADDTERMLEAIEQLGATVERTDDGDLHITGVTGRWRPPSSRGMGAQRTSPPPSPPPSGGGVTLNLQNAGTATRFLTAAAILAEPATGPITIDGNARMRERPIKELGDALTSIGVKVEYPLKEGYPPIRIHPPASLYEIDSEITFGRTASSQFISAILLIAPWLPKGMTVHFTEPPTSPSYISMTTGLLRRCGFQVKGDVFDLAHGDDLDEPPLPGSPSPESPPAPTSRLPAPEPESPPSSPPAPPHRPPGALPGPITVSPAPYLQSTDRLAPDGIDLVIEPDASSATYFLAAAAITPRSLCTIRALPWPSLQGDAEFATVLRSAGAEVVQSPRGTSVRNRQIPLDPFAYDFTNMPDAALTAAAVACFAEGRSMLWGLRTLRVKETDRIEALKTELAKVGVEITSERGSSASKEEGASPDDEFLVINAPPGGIDRSANVPRVEFDTYDDHRMAMALALIALRRPNTCIRNPACVAKTYPGFWRDLARLYGVLKPER